LENGRRLWLQLNIQPLIYKSNKYILVSFSDLSMVRKAQEEKVKKQAQMEMTARLSSMFAVAGGIAHEINNPLGIIVARLNSLLKKIESDHYDKDYFQKSIQKTIIASYRISTIVASLLALSKSADDLPMETVSLSEVLIDTFQLCRENLKHNNIDLIFDDIPDVLIKCRAIQIAQVLINLINNSIDAVANQKDKWIHFSFIEESDDILISVCDSGPRIPESIRLRMMEPFFTTKEVGKGAGLGLSVSKAIIEEHEGSLYLSNDSHKTCIIIQLKKEL
jgi:C4-dicarboxylate-specific signal transduction histidine kinase